MRDPNNPCLFCNVKESDYVYENDLAYANYDSYPVSNDHCLIIPKRSCAVERTADWLRSAVWTVLITRVGSQLDSAKCGIHSLLTFQDVMVKLVFQEVK